MDTTLRATEARLVPQKCRELEARKPRLLLRLPGSLLLRFAARQFCALLFHDPPRLTRFEPVVSPRRMVELTDS